MLTDDLGLWSEILPKLYPATGLRKGNLAKHFPYAFFNIIQRFPLSAISPTYPRNILYSLSMTLFHYIYTYIYIQCVPLTTEPGISLIILPLMRILQRNLKRTYLIV